MFMYQPPLSTQICAQIGGMCCNALCSESTCTHPLCSSFLHVGLFREGLQLLYLGLFFLEQVHDTAFIPDFLFASGPFVACCCFFFSTGVGAWRALRPPQECAWGIEPWHWVEMRGDWSMYILGRKDAAWSQYALRFTVFLSDHFLGATKLSEQDFFDQERIRKPALQVAIGNKTWLIMLDVEYWDVKSLQTVLTFYVEL